VAGGDPRVEPAVQRGATRPEAAGFISQLRGLRRGHASFGQFAVEDHVAGRAGRVLRMFADRVQRQMPGAPGCAAARAGRRVFAKRTSTTSGRPGAPELMRGMEFIDADPRHFQHGEKKRVPLPPLVGDIGGEQARQKNKGWAANGAGCPPSGPGRCSDLPLERHHRFPVPGGHPEHRAQGGWITGIATSPMPRKPRQSGGRDGPLGGPGTKFAITRARWFPSGAELLVRLVDAGKSGVRDIRPQGSS